MAKAVPARRQNGQPMTSATRPPAIMPTSGMLTTGMCAQKPSPA